MSEDAQNTEANWDSYMLSMNNKPGIIRLDMNLHHRAPVAGYKHRMRVIISKFETTEYGFPTPQEGTVLGEIEDAMNKVLVTQGAIFAGAAKSDGDALWYFYPKNNNDAKMAVDAIFENYKQYSYDVDIVEDVEWTAYFEFLFPSVYELRGMDNEKLINLLQEHGDLREHDRMVDHWFCFESETEARFCAKDLEAMDCELQALEKMEEEENDDVTFMLHISKKHNTELDIVNDITWEFISIAEKYNGMYDGWESVVVK